MTWDRFEGRVTVYLVIAIWIHLMHDAPWWYVIAVILFAIFCAWYFSPEQLQRFVDKEGFHWQGNCGQLRDHQNKEHNLNISRQVAVFALIEAGETVNDNETNETLEYRLRKLAESNLPQHRSFAKIHVVADDSEMEKFRKPVS
jgi:hypothetical protein